MACFLVPTTEAIIMTAVKKIAKSKESDEKQTESENSEVVSSKIRLSEKLNWLTNMLWGGSILLAFEHVQHGEVVPWFPFLTAAGNPQDASEMIHEMSTVGVSMAVLVTVIWGIMVAVTSVMEKNAASKQLRKI